MADFSDNLPSGANNVFKKGMSAADSLTSSIKNAKDAATSALANVGSMSLSNVPKLPSSLSPISANASLGSTPYEALTANVGWNENILSSLEQPTYHIRLFMTEDKPVIPGAYSSYGDLYGFVQGMNQTTIAETGTTGLNIVSLNIDSIAGPNGKHGAISATNMTIVVREPMGVGFMDMLMASANNLGVKNYAKIHYWLEVSFKGYDNKGGYDLNPCGGFPNKGKWLYQLFIKNMQVDVDNSGGLYTITATPSGLRLLDADHLQVPSSIHPNGTTLSEMFSDLERALNLSVWQMYGYQVRDYKFVLHDFDINGKVQNVGKWSIKPMSNPEFATTRSNDMSDENGKVTGHFARGTSIDKMIDTIFANCEEAQKVVKDVDTVNNLKLEKKKYRESFIFKVVPTVTIGEYDFATEDYILNYTIHIIPYYTQRPILDPDQVEITKDPEVQKQNALKLRQNGFLSKRYDYLFTGINTEVINLDLKFNLNWAVQLPRFMGLSNSLESSTPQNKKDLKNEILKKQKDIQEDLGAIAKATEDIDKNNTAIQDLKKKNKLNDDESKQLAQLEVNGRDLQGKLKSKQTDYNEKVVGVMADHAALQKDMNAKFQGIAPPKTKITYAEDLKKNEQLLERQAPMPITLVQSSEDTRFLANGAFPDAYHRDRSIYGTVLDQVYGPTTKEMTNINIEIKGDPYWLGVANLEQQFNFVKKDQADTVDKKINAPKSSPSLDFMMPSYENGDVMFLLTYKYPLGYTDTGAPLLKNNEFFTGVYQVHHVTHRFENGQFSQTLSAFRMPLISVFKAFGFDDKEGPKADAEVKQAAAQSKEASSNKQEQANKK